MTRRVTVRLSLFALMSFLGACGRGEPPLTELENVKTGSMRVVLLSDHEALKHGKDSFVLEFRDPGGALVDVGAVKANGSMPMPGMPMFGAIDVQRTKVAGRYAATGEFSMAGRWRLIVEWEGPAGSGSVSLSESVQ
jgi:YtkA-like